MNYKLYIKYLYHIDLRITNAGGESLAPPIPAPAAAAAATVHHHSSNSSLVDGRADYSSPYSTQRPKCNKTCDKNDYVERSNGDFLKSFSGIMGLFLRANQN